MKPDDMIFNYQCLSIKEKEEYEGAALQINLFSRQMARDEWMIHSQSTFKRFMQVTLIMYALFNGEGSLIKIIQPIEATDDNYSAIIILPWQGTGKELFEEVRNELIYDLRFERSGCV